MLKANIPGFDTEPQTHSYGSNEDHIQFTALRVNSDQVKNLWPMENT